MAAGQASHTGSGAGECTASRVEDKGARQRETSILSSVWGKGVTARLKWDRTMSKSRVACDKTVTRQLYLQGPFPLSSSTLADMTHTTPHRRNYLGNNFWLLSLV